MSAWLVTNRWLHWDKFEAQFDQLLAADNGRLNLCRVHTDWVASHLDGKLPQLALIMDKDVATTAQLESLGVRCVNTAQAIALCDNKAYTHARLTAAGIAHPRTVVAPLTFRPLTAEEWEASEFVDAVERTLGFPAVAKHAVGSWGSGVFLVHSRAELIEVLTKAAGAPVLVEEFVAGSSGRDARIYLVGDTPVAAMRRFGAEGDFRANITGGGRAEAWNPPSEYVEVARQAMAALGLEVGSVDFLDASAPLVGEVNSNAQFVTLAETTGIDVAAQVIDYLETLP